MDNKQFRGAVANMRQLQKEYFKSRDGIILARCKAAEKLVDELLKELEKEVTDTQQTLFK